MKFSIILLFFLLSIVVLVSAGEIVTNFTVANTGSEIFQIKDIAIDESGAMWFAMYGDNDEAYGGLLFYDGTVWDDFHTYNSDLPSQYVTCVGIDLNGDKWVGTEGGGVAKFDGNN